MSLQSGSNADVVESELLARLLDGISFPSFLSDREGRLVRTNPAWLAWAQEVGLPENPRLSGILAHGAENPAALDELWPALDEEGTWSRRIRRRDLERAPRVELVHVQRIVVGAGDELFLTQIVDLSPELADASEQAEQQRTELLLDLLGASLAELESPVRALFWMAELSDDRLAGVPEGMRARLSEVRRASQRIATMFRHVKRGADRSGVAEPTSPVRVRALLVDADPGEAARLLDGLQKQDTACLVQVARDREELLRNLNGGEVDVVLLGSAASGGRRLEHIELAQATTPGVPVFDLREAPLERLGPELVAAVRRRRSEDAASAAWKGIEEMALRDPLTGTLNRRAFERYGRVEFSRARRYGFPVALALFDLDHFKPINDELGHPTGDRVLEVFAAFLRAGARDSDLVARVGGDEFVVLMPHTDGAGAVRVAERLREGGARVVAELAAGVSPTPGVSVGVAVGPAEEIDGLGELFARADEDLYGDKRQRRLRERSYGSTLRPS